ncbi:MAG: hypothetical protein M1839_001815 [Geoglossum umbratile]|nr:MAG: hypothetical protein M1839_001815 [Geoglossum umbratile]
MFSSCLCRAARSGRPVALSVSISNRAPATSVAAPLQSFPRQRRHSSSSSSKPSSPPDGPRSIAQQNPTSSSRTKADDEKRSVTRPSRRKGRGAAGEVSAAGEALMNLPSVPSTTHLHPSDVAISAFFSLYRPISVTSAVPTVGTNSSFDTIFNSRSKSPIKPSQVISTLSSAVDSLEAAHQQGEAYEGSAEHDLQPEASAASTSNSGSVETVRHLDGIPGDSPLQFPGDLLSGRFRPFNPPPPPTPITPMKPTLMEETRPSERKSYSTVLTILESTLPNGSRTYNVTTSPIVAADSEHTAEAVPVPVRFLGRMLERQERWEEYRNGRDADGMWAISVKRQRKLKMKKMKYKKLMRKTRNLRRRLDRN